MLENIINNSHNLRLVSFYIVTITGIILVILALFIYIKYFLSLFSKKQISLPQKYSSNGFSKNISLILDMLRRKIEVYKIAQTVRQSRNYKFDEDEVLQTIISLKDFIDICNFSIDKTEIKQILSDLYDEDISSSLIFLDSIINKNIVDSTRFESIKNQEIKNNISELAYIYGNLAKMIDSNLAINSFELSIQLNPENFSSWSRLADVRKELGEVLEATKIYEMIIDRANEKEFPNAVVNSHKQLFEIYEQNEEYQGFEHYYDAIGINIPLSEEEVHILEIIFDRANKKEIIAMLMQG